MSSLHQTLPLNHPPPRQPTLQPPFKKPRINAKPKLTTHQITQPHVIQSAIRIGRKARQNPPQPGQEHKALDSLLRNMQTWAKQLAPQYTLAEFVLAAQVISGSRELRPMLGEFRLAELRDVNAENDPDNHPGNPTEPASVDEPTVNPEPGNAPVQADVPPADADVGPVEADVGPEDDDWDEIDLVPDEAIEVRPIRTNQITTANVDSSPKEDKLSPDIEAKIEQNRRAAIERRKAVIARLRADKDAEEKEGNKHVDASHGNSTTDAVRNLEQEKSKPKTQIDTASNSSPPNSETMKHPSQKLSPSQNESAPKSLKTALQTDDQNGKGEQDKNVKSKVDDRKEAQMDAPGKLALPGHSSQKQDESDKKQIQETQQQHESDERQEKKANNTHDISSTDSTKKSFAETSDNQDALKSDSMAQNEDNGNQDVDMEILAEFEDGDDA